MNLKNQSLAVIGGIIIILYVLPFVILTQYTHLGVDDICRTNSSFYNFLEGFVSWYKDHNGRYVNSLFSLLPVYDLNVYRGVLTTSMVLFFFVIYFFVKNLLSFFGHCSIIETLIVTLTFIILIFSELPSLYELFYWYAGATVYLYSSMFFLLLIIFLNKAVQGNGKAAIVSAFLIVLVTGSTEMYIPLVNLILFTLFIYNVVREKKIHWNLLILNIISLASTLAVYLAPGSEKRKSIFSESGQFFDSLASSMETAIKISWNRFNDPTIWMFLLVIFSFSFIKNPYMEPKRRMVNPIILLFFSAVGFVSVIFVPFFALGFLDYSAGRIIDCIYFTFFILFLINYFNLTNYFGHYISLNSFPSLAKTSILSPFFLASFLITVTLSSNNYRGMYKDFANKSYIKFDDQVRNRYQVLENSSKNIVTLAPVKDTKILMFDDHIFENECFIQHIRLNYNSQIKKIKLQSKTD